MQFSVRQFHRITAVLLCAVLFCLVGCTAETDGPVWEGYPIGRQFTYGIRTETLSALSPIVEETVGAMFLDNRHDVVVEDQICVNNTSYEIPMVLQDALLETMAEYKFETSFYVIDLETHASFAYNPQIYFECA